MLERFAAVRRVLAGRSVWPGSLSLLGPVEDYIVHCHPTGDDRRLLQAPSYYLIDQYLKAKAAQDFPRAMQSPVIVAGKYLNLTEAVPVSDYILSHSVLGRLPQNIYRFNDLLCHQAASGFAANQRPGGEFKETLVCDWPKPTYKLRWHMTSMIRYIKIGRNIL